MKLKMKNLSLLILTIIISLPSFGQIVIQSSDIGSNGDTTRYSYSSYAVSDIVATGTNYNWNFSTMVATSQTTDEFISVTSTGIIYSIAFFNKANTASPRDDMNMMGVTITDSYSFFKKSSSQFKIVGSGGKANGTSTPLVYDSPDILYRFPMSYGNLDSSDAHFSMNMASMGYIEQDLHRVNTVDGWGTITTPHGTYTCLRIKSKVFQNDSVFLASSGQGFRLPSQYTEYIWLAKNMNFPVMKAIVRPTDSYVMYMDDYIPFAGVNTASNSKLEVSILPNPSSDFIEITTSTNNNSISVIDIAGKKIYKNIFSNKLKIDVQNWSTGIYFVEIINEGKVFREKIIVK